MILTVTLNPALDITYTVPELFLHSTHRVSAVAQRAGGKGINVTRVLAALGHDVLATGFCGGLTGQTIRAALGSIPHDFEPITGENRRSVAVVDGDATVFNEPGPHVSLAEWLAFQHRFAALAARAQVVVLSGSLPQGLPADSYATLTTLARRSGAKVLLDTSGPALTAGIQAAPDVVKPNAAELAEISTPTEARTDPEAGPTGASPTADPRDTTDVAGAEVSPVTTGPEAEASIAPHRLITGGSGWPVGSVLVVSRGVGGMALTAADGAWEALPPEVLSGNATGAGDAAAAALAVALRDGTAWPEALADAVALSGASVVMPVAGEVDLSVYARLRPLVIVEEVPCRS